MTEDDSKLSLPHGRNLRLTSRDPSATEDGILTIADASGRVELEIELRDTGPVVRVRAAALELETRGALSLSCERFDLRAREGVRLASDGDLQASVAGDLDFRAAGLAHWEGKATRMRARRGEAQIEASDDVRVEGERVLLNS